MALSDPKKIEFIDSFWTFFVALAFLGPLALPLLWRNPRLGRGAKVAGSLFIVVFTAGLIWFSGKFLGQLTERYQELKSLQESSP
jgi:Na+/proline symporter